MTRTTPSYEHVRTARSSRVREILRVSATVDRPGVAREIILEWLENEAKTDLPAAAWEGGAFRHQAGDRAFTTVRAHPEYGEMWALRFVSPDDSAQDLEWTTEVAIRERRGQKALLSLRTLVRSAELKLRLQPVVPRFLAHVSKECGLDQGAAKVESRPWLIESDYDAGNLTEFLIDPQRRTPAFVLTVPEDADNPQEPLLDPVPLAADTLGTAKVIVLPAEFTWTLTNRFGKRLSVYRGAMRVYLAGFSERSDPEGGHDLFMPHRMDNPESGARLGTLLRRIAARESLRQAMHGQDVTPFASILMNSISSKTVSLAEQGATASEQQEAAVQHIGLLREELERALEVQRWLAEENRVLGRRTREAESKLRSAQHRRRAPRRHGDDRSWPRRPSHRNERRQVGPATRHAPRARWPR